MGTDKLELKICGRSVLEHSIRRMATVPDCTELIIVTREDKISQVHNLAKSTDFQGTIAVIPGGKERQDSVAKGLALVPDYADLS